MIRRIPVFLLIGIALLFAAPLAHAERDEVQFFSNIDVAPGAMVHDAVCFFCSVNIEGSSSGDIVVFFGSTHIAGTAGHDVVNFFGTVSADDNATIDHDLVSMFGQVRLGESVHVGNDMVAMFGSLHTGDGVSVEGNRVVQPAWIFIGPLFILVAVLILIVREFRAYRRRVFLRSYPFPPRF